MKINVLFTALALTMLLTSCGQSDASTRSYETSSPTVANTVDPTFAYPKQAFEQEVELLRQELNIPGISVAVLKDQEIVLARGFGYADLENKIPATENTPYYIASLTKPFAAVLIMKLVEAGQLDLDTAMADRLKDIPLPPLPLDDVPHPGYASACKKTIELSNDSSYPLWFLLQDYRCDTERITVRHHLTHTSQGTPGETYRYNGFLYAWLTWVVEAASGQSFEQQLVENITGPLEMTSTFPNRSDSRSYEILVGSAKPYRVDDTDNIVLSDFDYTEGTVYASAGMISTVLDLAKFDVAMDQNLIISEKSNEAMFSPHLSNSTQQPLPYGLGWFIQNYKGVKLIWHYGHEPDAYSSLILKVPEKELTLILLANSGGASAPFNLEEGDVLQSPFAAMFICLFMNDQDTLP